MTISVASLTAGEVQGAGMFDELMRTVKAQLELEYNAGRITGNDYAQTYLGAMTASLSTATQFILQYELTNQQLLLAQEQLIQSQEQTKLIQAQIAKMDADILISTKQLDVMDAQIAQTTQQTALVVQQVAKTIADTAVSSKQIEVMTSQITTQAAQVTLTNQQVINTTNENTTITKQQLKLDSEVAVLNQKKDTEEAQTKDVVNGISVSGILGKQAALYGQQTDGYKRDAEQKAAKILIDTWTVQRSTDETLAPYSSFNSSAVAPVISKLINGV